MFCKHCGTQIDNDAKFCPSCGKSQSPTNDDIYFQSNTQPKPYKNHQEHTINRPPHSVNFLQAIKNYYINYGNFNGRAVRSEYLWVCLYNVLASVVIYCLPEDFAMLGYAWSAIHLIPGLSIVIRRLHDVGECGNYWFIGLIPIVGPFILIYHLCKDSDIDNIWGRSPKSQNKSYKNTSAHKASYETENFRNTNDFRNLL